MLNPTKETLALTKAALNSPMSPEEALAKGVTVSTGLVYYDLQAPAKNLVSHHHPAAQCDSARRPVPSATAIPRSGNRSPALTSAPASSAMGWVPEGQRAGTMSYSATLQVF